MTIAVLEPNLLVIGDSGKTDVTCFGLSNGTAWVVESTITGGNGGYTYLWDDPLTQTTDTAKGLDLGQYNVIVSDSKNCKDSAVLNIIEPNLLVIGDSGKTDVTCFGLSDGKAWVVESSITGGNGGYTYLWDDPLTQTTDTAKGLDLGQYNVIVSDSKNCKDSAVLNIIEPNLLVIGASGKTDVTCFGLSDGTAWVVESSITGGNGGYTYLWDDPLTQTTDTANALAAGIYNIIVFDSILCSDTIAFTIQPADSLSVITEAKNLKCYNDNSGEIEVISITNGTAPYVYNWSGPNGYTSNAEDITSLEAGVYVLSLTDSNLCAIVDDSTIVLEPDTISISSTILQPSCNTNDGSISVVATGGGGDANPPNTYTYSWTDLGAGPVVIGNVALLDNIGAGLYEVTVTDDSLCVGSKEINISDINGPIVTDSTVDVTCNNDTDGKIFLTVTTQPLGNTYGIDWDIDNFIGATPPDLDGLQDSIVQTDLPAGVYFVRITDSSNRMRYNSC